MATTSYPNSGFSNNGPTSSVPTFGILPNIFGNGQPSQNTGVKANTPQGGYGPDYGMVGKNPGMIPTTPVKKITTPDGTSTEFHAPQENTDDNSSSSSSNNSSSSDSTSTTNPQASTDPLANAQNVINASNLQNNPTYNALRQQAGILVQGQQTASNVPFAGAGQSLGQSQEDLSRPQSTANLAGEEANFNNESTNTLGNINAQEQAMIAASQGATTGALGVLNAGLPRQNGYVNLNPYNPNTVGGPGDNSAIKAASEGAQIESGANSVSTYTTQNTGIENSINKLENIASGNNGSGGLIANMGIVGFNPASTPIGNQTFSNYFKNVNPAAQAGIQAGLGDIANNISTVLSSVTGLTPTAVSGIVSSYDFQDLTPSQLNDFLLYVKGYANNAIQGNNESINRIESGQSVNASNTPLPAPDPNSIAGAALGTGASLAEGLVNKVLSKGSDVVAGALGGLAGSVLQ